MLNQPRDDLRTEVAVAAARLIADDGLDYASAKHKAALSIVGGAAALRAALPDNAQIELELRRYLATFVPDHAQVLAALRGLALQLMHRLQRFRPHVVGAVLNGTATAHSDIRLQLFADSAKDVELFLLEQGVEFEAAAAGSQGGEPMETLHLLVRPARARGMPARVGVVLEIYAAHEIRNAPKFRSTAPDLHPVEACGRADTSMLERLIADCPGGDPS